MASFIEPRTPQATAISDVNLSHDMEDRFGIAASGSLVNRFHKVLQVAVTTRTNSGLLTLWTTSTAYSSGQFGRATPHDRRCKSR
jgi:hypothetical protein